MIRFVHTADIHLGTENYGHLDSKTGIHSRLLDFEKAFNTCIDYAINESVDFFLFCGDAYKTAHPSPTQQRILLRSLMRLYEAKIPVVIVVGNHDNPLSFGKAHSLEIFKELPLLGFHVINQPKTIRLETKGGPISIVGIPWPTRNTISLNTQFQGSAAAFSEFIVDSVHKIIQHAITRLDQTEPSILAAHLTVSTGIFSGSEKRAIYSTDPVFLPSQLACAPFDYVALGHLHRHQNANPHGYPALVYAGSIERIDFGERTEEKGFCLVSIKEKGATEYTFIRVPTRPFIQIEAHLDTKTDQTQQLVDIIKQHPIDDAIVKIIYHPPVGSRDTVNLQKVQLACARAMYLVGIIPMRQAITREQRSAARIDMDLPTLLNTYFETKPTWKSKKQRLVELTMSLYEQTKKEAEQD